MLTENLIKSELSLAYVHAVAARAGCSCEHTRIDQDSVDTTLKMLVDDPTSPYQTAQLDLQLKATVGEPDGTDISFDLPIKNYDDLRKMALVPRLLVVYLLPADASTWISVTDAQFVARRCGYWCNLRGSLPVANDTTRRVKVPRGNVFTPETLTQLMRAVAADEDLTNGY